MDLASYLAGRNDTLNALIHACDRTLEQAKEMGLAEDKAYVTYKDLKESLESLVEGTSNDKELS